jgi:cob(I)alamin adenosyltransferase
MPKLKKGLVQVYTGGGKGKTTAALGLALRAAGHGYRTVIIQFMKGQISYGELKAAKKFRGLIKIIQAGRKEFVSKKNPAQIDIAMAQKAVALAKEVMEKAEADILVLDEINCALDFGLVGLNQVLELIKKKPKNMELVLTGCWANKKLIQLADLVTEMKPIKHYYTRGVKARKGMEF